ncbi:glycine cleavage system protein T [Achromatium sp. WMS1]|nr:glycine cleavage system protein T [Achromatium sp. WMS1]
MTLYTSLYQEHIALGAKIVPFGGWNMPLHYGSQLEEHHVVRQHVGLFDVSHMAPIDIKGAEAQQFLQYLLANDVARLKIPGQALYSCMLQEQGGILDDLIIYFVQNDWYRTVVNAATADKDLAWMRRQVENFTVDIQRRTDLAMLALQGPNAKTVIVPHLPSSVRKIIASIKPFRSILQDNWFLGRTGYTGEDGFELILPHDTALDLWRALIKSGVRPCGLGARDTLRLEAGMNLYGTDMDESITPLESGLGWTVAFTPENRNFIGRKALELQQAKGNLPRFVGLILKDRGVLRNNQEIFAAGVKVGRITSGSFSPTLKRSIALARLYEEKEEYAVKIRNQLVPVRIIRPPFVRYGHSVIA